MPLSVGLLVGAFQQAALRRAVGSVPLWTGASSIGLMIGFSLALITGNIAWVVGLGNVTTAVVALCTLGGAQAMVTGAVLVRATAGVRAIRGLSGGGVLAEQSSPRHGSPLLGQLATAFGALPVLLLCGGLFLGEPVVRPDTTAEIRTSSVQVVGLEGGRIGLLLPGRAATIYVHEDHRQLFQHRALTAAPPEQPISVSVYRQDLKRLNQPVRVRALEVRSAERVYLPLEPVAAGRNAAEPVLLACTIGALAVLGYAAMDIVRQLVRRRA